MWAERRGGASEGIRVFSVAAKGSAGRCSLAESGVARGVILKPGLGGSSYISWGIPVQGLGLGRVANGYEAGDCLVAVGVRVWPCSRREVACVEGLKPVIASVEEALNRLVEDVCSLRCGE